MRRHLAHLRGGHCSEALEEREVAPLERRERPEQVAHLLRLEARGRVARLLRQRVEQSGVLRLVGVAGVLLQRGDGPRDVREPKAVEQPTRHLCTDLRCHCCDEARLA